jgi:hypothetical protein
MDYITEPAKITPYNTGKVRIGIDYQAPIYVDPLTPTMYRLQTSLLDYPTMRSRPSALIRALTSVFRLIAGRE